MSRTERRLQNYDARWKRILGLIRQVRDSGETELGRVVHRVEAQWRSTNKRSTRPTEAIALGKTVVLPHAALIGGRSAVITSVLAGACTSQTGMVVELGSGWGENLVNLYLAGGPKARYYALEPSPSGRECAEELARLEPGLDLTALPFDFEAPSYDLPRDNEHAVVFTVHSIEQILELPREALTGLFGLGESVTVVHFEPIGWQMGESTELARAYADRKRYNRNLWELLNALQDEGELAIARAEPDVIGHKPYIASSIVVWQR